MARAHAFASVVLTLALPATAAGAPFGELPFRTVPTAAECVRATGVPGELLRWSRGGFTLMRAGADGLRDTAAVRLGTVNQCPAVAADATTGAAVVAGATSHGIRAVVRTPGGAWESPLTIPAQRFPGVSAAVSARGDAVVAWLEYDGAVERTRLRTARRAAGAVSWTVQPLADYQDETLPSAIDVGMTAAGEAITVFTLPGRSQRRRIQVATARPGAPFGPAHTLATPRSETTPALAVAPDGRVLVAISDINDLSVYERSPGGDWSRPQSVFDAAMSEPPAVALRPDGGAVLAWRQGPTEPLFAVARDGPGPFGALMRSAVAIPRRRIDYGSFGVSEAETVPAEIRAVMRAAFGQDGRALVVYPTEDRGFGVATLTSAAPGEHALVGSALRDPLGLTPLLLPGGGRAVAWSDNGNRQQRLHYAVEGAAGAAPAAPAVSAGAPRRRALRPAQSLELPVHCSAACDLRAWIPGHPPNEDVTATLTRAGTALLRLRPNFRPIAPADGHPLRVRVRYGAPGARQVKVTTVKVRLRRLPAPPFPHIVNPRARRIGDDIEVRWDTDRPARDVYFDVLGTRAKSRADGLVDAAGAGRGRRHFRVRLGDARRVRYVWVQLGQYVGSANRTRVIRVG